MRKTFLTILMTLTAMAAATLAYAAEPVGELSFAEGRVDRKPAGSEEYIPMVRGEEILAGDTLRTKGFSRAEVAFKDKSIVKLGENSQVKLDEYALNAAGLRQSARLHVDRGVIRAIVSKSAGGATNFLISTPNSTGSVKGSDICVSYAKSASMFLAISGAIETSHLRFPDKTVLVQKGTTAFVPADAPPATPRPYLPIEQDRFEDDTAPLIAKDGTEITPEDLSHAIVTAYSGDVRIRTNASGKWHRAALKESLGQGDEIETGENGSLRMVLESGRIVELGPDTQLKIERFVVDPKTGAREDRLESGRGRIRARIEKLKAGSTFQVRTPTAVAAVRGTIMYLNISPAFTRAFFQAGPGSLTNLLTGVEKAINPDQNAASDDQGNVTDPTDTTSDEQQQNENDFNSQDQTYGYSAPEGGPAADELPPFLPAGGDTTPENPTDDTVVFDQIPTDVPASNTGPAGPEPVDFGFWGNPDTGETSLYYNNNGLFNGPVGEESGVLNSIDPIWDAVAPFDAQGTYTTTGETDAAEPLLWNTPLMSGTRAETVSYATPDGGAFYGYTAGIWNNNAMDGAAAAIYLDPDGNAGFLTSDILGNYTNADPGTGLWQAAGDFFSNPQGDVFETDPETFADQLLHTNWDGLEAEVAGTVGDDGSFQGSSVNGWTTFIHDEAAGRGSKTWGIFDLTLGTGEGNTFIAPTTGTEWQAAAGGSGSFGHYYPSGAGTEFDWNSDWGYWLTTAFGTAEDGEIRGGMGGAYLTNMQLGLLVGDVSGLYDISGSYGNWAGQSVGIFDGAPLTFFSSVNGSLDAATFYYNGSYSYYNNSYYNYSYYRDNSYGNSYYYDYSNWYSPYDAYNPPYNSYSYEYNYYYSWGSHTRQVYNYPPGQWSSYDDTWSGDDLSFLANNPYGDYYDYNQNANPVLYEDGSVNAYLGGVQSLWTTTGPVTALMIGYIGSEGGDYSSAHHVWGTSLYSSNPVTDDNTTHDGGAYRGFIGGTHHDGAEMPLEVGLAAVYIDPSGKAGTLTGHLSGVSYNGIGMFAASGDITRNEIVHEDLGIAPEDLDQYLSTSGGDGTLGGASADGLLQIQGEDDLQSLSIVDYANENALPWGVYSQEIVGSFTNESSQTAWSGAMGGYDSFGVHSPTVYHSGYASYYDGGEYNFNYYENNSQGYEYYYRPDDGDYYYKNYNADGSTYQYDYYTGQSTYGTWDTQTPLSEIVGNPPDPDNVDSQNSYSYGTAESDGGYWLASVTNGQWADDALSADLNGSFITRTKLGSLSGEILGVYDNTQGLWGAFGVGTWEGEPLKFFSDLESSVQPLTGDYWSIDAYLGGTNSLWAENAELTLFTVIGSTGEGESDIRGIGTWQDEIRSYNALNDTDTTFDGGAYAGVIGGNAANNSIDGRIAAIYVNPAGQAGLLTGEFSGNNDPYINMFSAEGSLTVGEPIDPGIGIAPEDLSEAVFSSGGDGYLSGAFSAADSYIQAYENLNTYSIVDYSAGISHPWGVYSQNFEEGWFYNPNGDTAWSAMMGGNDQFGLYNPTWRQYGNNTYYQNGQNWDGYYNYWYNERNTGDYYQANEYYYRPSTGENYYIDYYADGTYSGYDWYNGIPLYGTWDQGSPESITALLITPPTEETPAYSDQYRSGIGQSDYGYWLASIEDGTWSENELTAELHGQFITQTKMGSIDGNILGVYDESGNLRATGIGTWVGAPLTFSGYWDEDSLYYNDGGYVERAGSEYGLIGGTSSPWNGPSEFLAMGEFYLDGVDEDEPLFWNTPIASYNAFDGENTTIDGGAFYGYTAGLWKDGTLQGAVASLYMDPDGNAGVLAGDVNGSYYSDLGMWAAGGTLTPTPLATADELGIDPQDFVYGEYIEYGDFGEIYLEGFFGTEEGEGYIEGYDQWGNTAYIYQDVNQTWGIFDLKLGSESYYENPELSSIWFAFLEGYGDFGSSEDDHDGFWIGMTGGSWVNGGIRGGLRGIYVTENEEAGLISGDFFGLYSGDEEGDWVGESVGIFRTINDDIGFDDDDFEDDPEDYLDESELSASGMGNFVDSEGNNIEGSSINVDSFEGGSLGIQFSEQEDAGWGIWAAIMGGAFQGAPADGGNFSVNLSGDVRSEDNPVSDTAWLAQMNGRRTANGLIEGSLTGVWVSVPSGDPFLEVGTLSGDMVGDSSAGTSGTWQALAVGEYQNTNKYAIADAQAAYDNVRAFIEAQTSLSASIVNNIQDIHDSVAATASLAFYGADAGIWAGLFSGNFNQFNNDFRGENITFAGDGYNATLQDINAQGGIWDALVTGAGPSIEFDGSATGTYTGSGNNPGAFSGVGAGSWETAV